MFVAALFTVSVVQVVLFLLLVELVSSVEECSVNEKKKKSLRNRR